MFAGGVLDVQGSYWAPVTAPTETDAELATRVAREAGQLLVRLREQL